MHTKTALVLAFTLFLVNQMRGEAIKNWPEDPQFKEWATRVVAEWKDPKIKCNKITGIDSTAIGAIRVMGIWCAQSQGLGSAGMNVAVRLIGRAINASFRRDFPTFRGPIAISLLDRTGQEAFGSRDWN